MVGLQSVGTIKLIFIEQSHTRRMEARSDRQTAATMTFCQPMPLLKLITSADCGLEIVARPVESRGVRVASVGRSAAGEGGHAALKQLRGFKSSCRPGSSFLTRIPPYLKEMRGFAIIIIAFLALSATGRGHPAFVPRPTGPLPAVNVP